MKRTKDLFTEIECWLERRGQAFQKQSKLWDLGLAATIAALNGQLSIEAAHEISRAWRLNQATPGTDKLPIRDWARACAAGHAADPAAALGFDEGGE